MKKELASLGVELRDVQGIIQPEKNLLEHTGFQYDWSVVSPSRKGEAAEAEDARGERVQFLVKSITKQIHLAQMGYTVRPAPIGLMNQRIEDEEGKRRSISVPHPIESNWISTIFDLRAQGILPDQEICDRINAMGFRTRTRKKRERFSRKIIGIEGGVHLTPKRMERIITNPRYCNVVQEKWTQGKAVIAQGPSVTTIDTFNDANRGKVYIRQFPDGEVSIEYNRRIRNANINNPTFPYRFVVRCPECGGNFKGSFARGKLGKRYPGYHCSRGHKYLRKPQKDLHSVVREYFSDLNFSKQAQNLFQEVAFEVWQKKQHQTENLVEGSEQTSENLKREQKLIVDQLLKTTSPTVQKLLEQKVDDLEKQILKASTVRKKAEIQKEDLKQYLASIAEIMTHPAKALVEPTDQQTIRRIWGITFSKLPTYDELKSRTPELSLAFELSQRSKLSKERMVALLFQKWNTFARQLKSCLDY